MKKTLILALTLSILAGTPRAHAGRRHVERLAQRRLKLKRALARGTIDQLKARKVRVGGREDLSIQDLADRAFVKHRKLQANLRKARRALLRDPVVEEEAIETDDATLLVATVKVVVVDPAALYAAAPELADMAVKAKPKGKAKNFAGEAKTNFEALKADLRKEPANHPLRQAMEAGDDALLEAISSGVGDVEMTTTISIPKEAPDVSTGVLKVPAVGDAGFDYLTLSPLKLSAIAGLMPGRLTAFLPQAAQLIEPLQEAPEPTVKPTLTTKGSVKRVHKFVTGFTVSNYWEWEDHWSFCIAEVSISAGASYGFGLRAPLRVTAEVDPTVIKYKASEDKRHDYTVEVTATTVNAPEESYEEVGMDPKQVQDGYELVLNASAYFKVRGSVDLWWTEPSVSLNVSAGFDHNRHFKPPFGDCGTSCGFDFWLPSELTRTNFNAGVVRGDAQVGFKLTGDGEIQLDYESYYGQEVLKSKHAGEEKKLHKLVFKKEQTKKITTTLTKMEKGPAKEKSKDFGYRLSAPIYRWDVDLIPGLQGGVTVDLGVWDHRFTLGPWWFDVAKVNLGTIKMERHKGTTGAYKNKPGTKTWTKL